MSATVLVPESASNTVMSASFMRADVSAFSANVSLFCDRLNVGASLTALTVTLMVPVGLVPCGPFWLSSMATATEVLPL
ncbi:hypothetical protein AEGHOMDF_2595 [Methylobacterium soli]|nr:hypothetical protein AEGHOMDF_2595 [Methylobacterium soli]